MDQDALMREMRAVFIDELAELLEALERDLLAVEKAGDSARRAPLVNALFRAAHTIKGAARAVGYEAVEALAHVLEERLAEVRAGTRTLDEDLVSRCFAAKDVLAGALGALRAGQTPDSAALGACARRIADPSAKGFPQVHQLPERDLGQYVEPDNLAGPGQVETGDGASDPATLMRQHDKLAAASVRVPATRLDALRVHCAELRSALYRLDERASDVADIRETAQSLLRDWQRNAVSRAAVRAPLPESFGADLQRLLGRIERLSAELDNDTHRLDHAASPIEHTALGLRMQPFRTLHDTLARAARDVAAAEGKELALELKGGEVEIDRAVLGALSAPLLHMVRNAVHHGIESPDQRRRAGKPTCARISVIVSLRGSQVTIAVDDDGRGLDAARIREVARARGLSQEGDIDPHRVIFEPGFSTASQTTAISGRGVGLDVVRDAVGELYGTVDVTSAPGQGTRFDLVVPLTLSSMRALLVRVAEYRLALVTTNVVRVFRLAPAETYLAEGRVVCVSMGRVLPVVSLAHVLGIEAKNAGAIAVHVAAGERHIVLVVEQLEAERELLSSGLGPRFSGLPCVSGAAQLEDGDIALLLNAAEIVRRGYREDAPSVPLAERAHAADASRKHHVLVVEDSMTTRTLVKSILENAGYRVSVSPDGAQAWRRLQEEGIDVVVSDVEMPHMGGLELTMRIRESAGLRAVPVVLVTSKANDEDRRRGLRAGANAYLAKSAFDQAELLQVIEEVLVQ